MLGWPRNALRNILRLTWLKTVGGAAYMFVYFHFYFLLLRHPVRAVTVFPLTDLDRALPFQPWSFWPYISMWVYVCLPSALQPTLATLLRHGVAAAGLCVIGIASYYFLPSTFQHAGEAWPAGHVGAFLGEVDLAHNVFPSMHVAFACFAMVWLRSSLQIFAAPRAWQVGSVLWCIVIVYSTLATKQHIVWDVLAGAIIGLLWGWVTERWARPGMARDQRRVESSGWTSR